MMRQLNRLCSLTALATLLVSTCSLEQARAQVLYGSMTGTIEDPSGASVPNVTVTLTNKETGQVRDTKSDSSGGYNFVNVPPGTYDVKASSSGFRTINKTDITVSANTIARADFQMEVGQVSESVNVSAQAVQLQTDKATSQTTISTKPIEVLPMNIYRNYQALINLVPGATPAAFQNSSTDTPGRSLRTFVNGTPTNMNITKLDGAVNVNIWLPHHNAYVAPSETVQEVNVATSAMDADQGLAGGAGVTVITKSGTNDLHGSAWEFHNNQYMKSRPYFMPSTQTKPRDTLNIFGGTLGGKIIRNKLFYFGNFEGTRQRIGAAGIYDVPTAGVRNGDFSRALVGNNLTLIYDPNTGNPDGTGRTPFAGNIIPADRISPVARRILQNLPGPNQAGEIQNFVAGATGVFDRNNYDYKINWNRNERHTIWGKSSFMVADVGGVPIFGDLIGPGLGGDPATGHTFTQVHTIAHSYTLSPTLLFDQNLGFTRNSQTVLGRDYGKNWGLDTFGIPGTNGPDIRQSGMPNFNFGYTNVGQANTWIPLFRTDQSYTFDNNLTWLKGAHQFRFGYNLVRHHLNHWQPEIANPRGEFTFGGAITSLSGGAAPNFYNQFAAFLLGSPSQITKSLQYILMTGREWQHSFYAQDRWTVSRKLTLSLGLRINHFPLMTRASSGLERLDVNTMQLYLGGRGSVPQDAGLSVNTPLFAPTLGIAYRVSDNTVIRTGYGINWDPLPYSRPLRGFYPLTVSGNFVGPNDFTPAGSFITGAPPVVGPDLSTGIVPLPPTVDERSPWGKINRGYIQSWNFTMEHRLPGQIVASAGYVGTKMTHQLADRNINAALPGVGAAGAPLAARFGRRIALNMWDGWLDSNYHSLQTTVNRQFANGLFLKGAYTFAKAINMTDENGWASVVFNSPEVVRRSRARAGYDRSHVFQMAFIYEPPVGKGKRFLNNGVVSYIVGNWALGGIYSAYSGNPLTIASNAACNCPGNLQTADQVKADPAIYNQYGPGAKYFDTTAFAAGAANRFGSSGRNILEGPGVAGLDGNISRVFPIKERLRFEFRGEAFNVTNTPRFGNPSVNVNSATYGEVRSASGERQIRVGAILRF